MMIHDHRRQPSYGRDFGIDLTSDTEDSWEVEVDSAIEVPLKSSDADKISIKTPCHVALPIEIWERIISYMSTKDVRSMSMVSKQHQAVTRSVFFRARYFLHHNKRCNAIYAASRYPFILTTEMLTVSGSKCACFNRHGGLAERYTHGTKDTPSIGRSTFSIGCSAILCQISFLNNGRRRWT